MSLFNLKSSRSRTTMYSWKLQIAVAAGFGLIILVNQVFFSVFKALELFQNFLANVFIVLLIWKSAVWVSQLGENFFNWLEKPLKRVFLSAVLGLICSFLVVLISAYFFQLLYQSSFPANNEIFINTLVSFLLFSVLFTGFNIIHFLEALREKQVKETVERLGNYFEQLIENIEDIVQVWDTDGRIKYSSPSAEHQLEYAIPELTEFPPFYWILEEDKSKVKSRFKAFLEEEKNGVYFDQFRVKTKTGTVKMLEVKISDGRKIPMIEGLIVTCRDITERHETEQLILRQKELYELTSSISGSFLRMDFHSALVEMLEKMGKFSSVDRVYVYQLNPEKNYWNCLHEWRSEKGDQIPSIYYQKGIPIDAMNWTFNQLSSDKILNYKTLDKMPPEAEQCRKAFEADGTVGILLLPLRINGELVGMIGYDALFEPKNWSEDDIRFLRLCSEILTSSLARSEAEASTRASLSFNQTIIDSSAEGFLLANLENRVVYANEIFHTLWELDQNPIGLSVQEVSNLVQPKIENKEEIESGFEILRENRQAIFTMTLNLHNGKVLEVYSAPQIQDGKLVGRIWSNRDITDRILSQREELEKGMAVAQFESLKTQVNPHFLFNSLNVLSSLVHVDADLSEKFIDQLAKSYRYLLEQKDNTLVPLEVELDFVYSFVFLLKIRFEEKIQLEVDIPERFHSMQIAPLTMQLLIENAVKHNKISEDQPLKILIGIEGHYLVVKNSLQVRINHAPSTGLGLKNIQKRYLILSSDSPKFGQEGDLFVARIPLIEEK
ncbi:histidine kinase [Aquiflexum gelatinilyticum]|uniref:Histidine kinase n=1 Tax=Aquiflexum gelatinilyticum TaxID=2961943 RepID=A0A9X2T2Q2_9BACT|nr:histidine kinase [Aquiflexum gelatinilyticum]MCR9015710.1 histidine kinase [Aquiflexum gelatinilyticum]